MNAIVMLAMYSCTGGTVEADPLGDTGSLVSNPCSLTLSPIKTLKQRSIKSLLSEDQYIFIWG